MGDVKQINKSAIKNFAIEARNILIKSAITEAGFYGISKDEISRPVQKGTDFEVYKTAAGTDNRIFGSDIKRRANLVKAIQEKGFDEVIEETAYTWFNRLIAIRFMEVNDYLPSRVRVLSSETGSGTPDLVTQFLDVDLNMSEEEIARVQKAKDDNQYDEAFRLLFIKACNELNDILPGLFEKTDDYKELLLNLPYTSNGVVRMLVDTIPESNFNVNEGGQVEIIGWLYQYYNTEPKAKAFAKKGKITKEEIPAVTQLFTPDWIVRYMVENSLGRLWIEHLLANGDSRSEQEIANDFGWKYYLPEAEQEPEVQVQLAKIREERKELTPQDILCIDPCQGSGHILVYLYDVLMQIYREDGYSERDAARSILENNLYGLDIDDRAYQLSYFAVLMKARQYDRVVLKKKINPHVFSIQESNSVNRVHLKYFGAADTDESTRNKAIKQLTYLLDTFKDAKEYGSILNVEVCDWDLLREYVKIDVGQFEFEALGIDNTRRQILPLIDVGETIARRYYILVTNPPYMGGNNMNQDLSGYVKKNYAGWNKDLYACFMKRSLEYLKENGYMGFMTSYTWMFLTTFSEVRKGILGNRFIQSLVQPEYHSFFAEAFVPICSFVIGNTKIDYKGGFIRLEEFYGAEVQEAKFLKALENLSGCTYYFKQKNSIFKIIPDWPIAYWLSESILKAFSDGDAIGNVAEPRQGLATADNDRFLRVWHEVNIHNIGFEKHDSEEAIRSRKKWFPYCKGGGYRKWAGNTEYVINWEDDGRELRNFKGSVIRNPSYYFKTGLTWGSLTVSDISFRYVTAGFLFDSKGPICFSKDPRNEKYLLALLNSKVAMLFLSVLAPTMDYSQGPVSKIPYFEANDKKRIEEIVDQNIALSLAEWNSFESSWGFMRHPLLPLKSNTQIGHEKKSYYIKKCYENWEQICEERFKQLKKNEEELNKLFISIYGLESELSSEIEDKNISIRKADLQREIRSLISYAVGCIFGRYSLDCDGLICAGEDWKRIDVSKYKTFQPDEDAIIPITDEEYFNDDIVARFVEFISAAYGKETLESNLQFIADALGKKGETPRAVIRAYFLNDFYKEHCAMYSATGSGKRPIYWLFDSGKQNGFKALIYIHRYTPDTVGLIRSVYLHNAQEAIQNSLKNAEYVIATTASAVDRAANTKKRDKYIKQLNELRPYYQAISHVALQQIEMDLDNGVKKNYQLFQGIEISSEGKKKQTIDLLAKI